MYAGRMIEISGVGFKFSAVGLQFYCSTMPDLTGQNCIVTGASRGLGASIAARLWKSGSNLLLVGRSEQQLRDAAQDLSASGGASQTVHVCPIDLSDSDSGERILDHARRLWTRLDGLVNNAAIQGPIGVLWENDWSEWTRTIQVNLLAPVSLCRLAVRWMETTGGSIVNLAGGGATSPRPNFTSYATAKAALVRFSETLAHEVETLGIRINCVAPGAMNTDMLRDLLAAGAERAGASEYDRALRREKEGGDPPEQAAELVEFLLSSKSAGITGKLISAVWDPWRTWTDHRDEFADPDLYTLRRITSRRRAPG